MTVYTVIFGPYEELKEPRVVTPGWKYVCFTDQPLDSHYWQIIPVDTWPDKRMHSREYKINFDRYIDDEFSLYLDGSFIINCNLNDWWRNHFQPPMTFVKHPRRNCVYAEIDRCIELTRCNPAKLKAQKMAYLNKVKPKQGVIQSGLMMRQRTPEVIELMRSWWDELQKYSSRDQISFAFVTRLMKMNAITWNYAKGPEFLFIPHFNRRQL